MPGTLFFTSFCQGGDDVISGDIHEQVIVKSVADVVFAGAAPR